MKTIVSAAVIGAVALMSVPATAQPVKKPTQLQATKPAAKPAVARPAARPVVRQSSI
ncbi:MAG: hypothetical protein IKE60_02120 [Reyranella sp.]|uniref:hypothetical protein n=1 Tax=Reyranella sp. TaxID=1929291 RepID=UPI0025F995B7|nr:hypothetical protein [Reyranella sp.]MBR2813417.1 hypothetical protein [Reyranella sp.]